MKPYQSKNEVKQKVQMDITRSYPATGKWCRDFFISLLLVEQKMKQDFEQGWAHADSLDYKK